MFTLAVYLNSGCPFPLLPSSGDCPPLKEVNGETTILENPQYLMKEEEKSSLENLFLFSLTAVL